MKASGNTTKELSTETWADFEKLFTKPGIGDASSCWCTFHHTASFTSENNPPTRAEAMAVNRRRKRDLVKKGQAHGILVYTKEGEPVGWCQYGPREELPRMDHTRVYLAQTKGEETGTLWRITCFVVDKNYRKHGVASAALSAALDAIRGRGGGLVEAYPVKKTELGPGFMNKGTVNMFVRAGFKTVSPLRTGRNETVLMRKMI